MSDRPEIRIYRDPLRPRDYERCESAAGVVLIDWLYANYPAGFGRPIIIHVNSVEIAIEHADVELQAGDIVHIMVQPGAQAIPFIIQAVVTAAIAAVAALAYSLIFRPTRPKSLETPAPDPIYSITSAQNAARLGEPVPALYGGMVTVPDFGSQPYTFFEGNNQILDQLLVIGQGEYVLHDVLVGETPVSALESDAVQYWLIGPAQHNQTMGNIRALTGIMENVVSSPEVSDQEVSGAPVGDVVTQTGNYLFRDPNQIQAVIVAPPAGYPLFQVSGSERNNGTYTVSSYNAGTSQLITVENSIVDENSTAVQLAFFKTVDQQVVGPFITSKPGTVGDQILCDFVWPGGLYKVDSSGKFIGVMVQFNIEYQQVDNAGAPVGAWQVFPVDFGHATNTPQRRTWVIDVPPARYRVRVRRLTPLSGSANETSNFIWAGLKFRLIDTVGPVYGPVSFLAIRIRATNGIASSAASRIRARVTRKLPRLGSGAAIATRSPADAFVDVYCNQVYGAKRPLAEIDMAELVRIETSWGGQAKFDGGFSQKSTIWEALSIVLQTANAAPLPTGQLMSLAQDGVKASRRQLFSDANMTTDSLAIGYSFDRPGDHDGIRVEYRDPTTWNAKYVIWPVGALEPDDIQLFGCSDETQAIQFARLLWQKRLLLRKTAHFETELEGLLVRVGDRIAVSSQLPRWGASGIVVGYSGNTLWLDNPPDWTGSGHKLILRNEVGQPSGLLDVTPGTEPNALVVAGALPFPIFGQGRQEPTHYAFGASVSLVRDFTVQNMEHRGGTSVAVECLAYEPAAYNGTLPWLETPT